MLRYDAHMLVADEEGGELPLAAGPSAVGERLVAAERDRGGERVAGEERLLDTERRERVVGHDA